ncbi:hypothetical protein D3C74_302080 [compost metagenome]
MELTLWSMLETRGRVELELENDMHLYSVDLKDNGYAYLKFAAKYNGQWCSGRSVEGNVKYRDLR